MSAQTIVIQPSRPVDIQDGLGLKIEALCGTVWITQSGDLRDVILTRGESFTLDRNGLSIVSALLGTKAAVSLASGNATTSAKILHDETHALPQERHAA